MASVLPFLGLSVCFTQAGQPALLLARPLKELPRLLMEQGMIGFEDQHVITALLLDLVSNGLLGVEDVGGYYAATQRQSL